MSSFGSSAAHRSQRVAHSCVFASTATAAKSIAAREQAVTRILLGAQPEAGCKALDSYLRPDWEYRLIARFEPAARSWHLRNGGEELFRLNGIDLAGCGRFSFLTRVILEKGRTLAAISDALETLAPSEVYCDAALAAYLHVVFDGSLHVCGDDGTEFVPSPRTASAALDLGAVVRELVFGLGYKLLCATTVSRWLQVRCGAPVASSSPVLVGSEHGLKNLEPLFAALKRTVNVLRPVGQLQRNRGLANREIDWRVTYLESLLKVGDAVRVGSRLLRVARWFYRTYAQGGFRNLMLWKGRDCFSLFASDFARFVLAHSAGAFRNRYIAERLVHEHRPSRVFFDNANAWEFSVMVEHLRRAGIPTTGFVNGLVQDIIPFRCAVDTLLTGGEWDRKLLQMVMGESHVVAYGNPSPMASNSKANNLLLISSSCRDHANRRAFARVVAEYIESSLAEDDFDEIVLKLHPYEDPDAMRSYFADFPRAAARLRITRQGLDVELSHARLAICLLSTVIRDLAWNGTPFLLFDSVEWPTHTFYSQVPDSVKFTSSAELAAKAEDLNSLLDQSVHMRNLYFGQPTQDAIGRLRFHLFGESD